MTRETTIEAIFLHIIRDMRDYELLDSHRQELELLIRHKLDPSTLMGMNALQTAQSEHKIQLLRDEILIRIRKGELPFAENKP